MKKNREVYTCQYKNRVDQWSYGITIFELMLRGFKNDSFENGDSEKEMKKGLVVLIPPLNWNKDLIWVIKNCNNIEPQERPEWDKILEILKKIN